MVSFFAGVLSMAILTFFWLSQFVKIEGSSLLLKKIPASKTEIVFPRKSGDIRLTQLDYSSGDPDGVTLTIEGDAGEWLFLPCESSYKVGFNSKDLSRNLSLVDFDEDMIIDGALSANESLLFEIDKKGSVKVTHLNP